MKVRVVLAAACLAAALSAVEADSPALIDLKVNLDGENYVASCRLESGFTPEILQEIDAGLETTIGYRLQVTRHRPGPLPDESIARHRIRCTVRYDALTRQYALTRRIDGEVQDTRVTADAQAMREFLTVLRRVPVMRRSELIAGQIYTLRAKSEIGFTWRFYLIPWPIDTEWVRIPIGVTEGKVVDAAP